MSTLALMYHATPNEVEKPLDVPIARFREQIDRLIDSGTSFIPFSRIGEPDLLSTGRHVAITFDDGHASNFAAAEYLASRNIMSTLFVVRDWSKIGVDQDGRQGFMPSGQLREAAAFATLGAHGATHRGFSTLVGTLLEQELEGCRNFLGELTGTCPVELALPGGDGNIPAVLDQCLAHGFNTIGSSVQDINRRQHASYARLVVGSGHDAAYPQRIAERPDIAWGMLRLARRAKSIAREMRRL